MTDRERFLACILGERVDRPPYWLYWGPWGSTWKRWQEEASPEELENYRLQHDPDKAPEVVPVNCGPCPRMEKKILEEDENYVVFTDTWGIKRRDYKHAESMSEFLEFPVKTRADWTRLRKEWFDPDHPQRLTGRWREACADWMRREVPVQLGYYPDVGIYGTLRWLLGDEECLVAFYTMPDLVHDIMDHMTEVYLTVFDKVAREARVDVIHLWEDFCGKQGPLISPKHWDEFIGPCYRRIKRFADERGIPVISVDTDGRPELVVPVMMKAGVNYLFPMEVAAGCDVNALRKKFPTLGMMGGIDKRALAAGHAAIDRELARIRPAVEKGRYIPDLDHLIPSDVPYRNYAYYAAQLKKLVGKV